MKAITSFLLRASVLILCINLFSGTAIAQDASSSAESQWEAELGLKTGIAYEQRLSDHFILKAGLNERVLGAMLFGVIPNATNDTNKLVTALAFMGLVPSADLSFRWFPRTDEYNSGFYLGLGLSTMFFNFSAAKRVDPDTGYGLSVQVPVGYKYQFCERWGLKGELLPEIASFLNNTGEPYGGFLGFSADIGITYNF